MSVGQEFWIVAVGCKGKGATSEPEKDGLLAELKRYSALFGDKEGPQKFEVPDGESSLLFGSFDTLIKLTDDLAKFDGSVDGIVHRLERQYLELDAKAEFKVKSQRQEKPFLDYLKTWQWDEAKYPKTRSVSDNLTLLMSVVNKLDEEARNKTAQYNEFKTQKGICSTDPKSVEKPLRSILFLLLLVVVAVLLVVLVLLLLLVVVVLLLLLLLLSPLLLLSLLLLVSSLQAPHGQLRDSFSPLWRRLT
ncbi:unnamed protein product [Polarella glacialis]|uniref:V-type proton ATPase subunit C n=1 Tax=Polarella glacialis TaxID=89957 RepID=A0A813EWD6_POLGL|nr:unnamed protein product [Polarella glacialis]